MSEISLNHAVRQAISASNAKYDDEDIIDRVRARKNKAFGSETEGREERWMTWVYSSSFGRSIHTA